MWTAHSTICDMQQSIGKCNVDHFKPYVRGDNSFPKYLLNPPSLFI